MSILGVFANRSIQAGEIVCLSAGYLVTQATRADVETQYMWADVETGGADDFDSEINTWLDAGAFSKVVLAPDRVGHCVNTSHPAAKNPAHRAPNVEYSIEYVRTADGRIETVVTVKALCNIAAGTELLADYHWHLAFEMRKAAHTCKKCTGKLCGRI